MRFLRPAAVVLLGGATVLSPCPAFDKPTGAPLVMSDIETEQPVPLAVLSPDGRTASCVLVRLHWSPSPTVNSDDETTSFDLDLPTGRPGAGIFLAQLWNASFAGSLAWQKPWQGAHWKILQTPETDGTGIDAALAVGMIATSARRPYPKTTLVIGNLHPDSSLGAVAKLTERLDAAAREGITRVIVPKVQLFETGADGQLVNIQRHAEDLHLECLPVDNIREATEVAMNDPLPDPPAGADAKVKPGEDVTAYVRGFAGQEQAEAESGLQFAPKESAIDRYPPRQAAVWRQVYAEFAQGREANKSGQVYTAYRLLARANSRMRGQNALAGQNLATFDVKTALATSDELRARLHSLMTPPSIDRAELQSAMLVAEMADWAYDIDALLQGSALVTKQTFSRRSDATAGEREHAREAILSANEEARYLLNGAEFYTGLLPRLGDPNPLPANTNAARLLPQLIPAQLAVAEIFANGIRPQAGELRDGLLFDPRLVAYVNVLREEKTAWDAHQRRRAAAKETPPASTAPATTGADASTNAAPAVPNATNGAPVGFDFGSAYEAPHTTVEASGGGSSAPKMSEVAQCLIWVNTDCEIQTLDEKYLRLTGTIDPATREWHVKDRADLDALLQLAESGATQGLAFAREAQVDPSLFAMILERATYLRHHGDDSSALAGLRQYWRCALLGNMCWQLAHTHKAAAVDLSAETAVPKNDKDKGKNKSKDKPAETASADQEKARPARTPESGDETIVPATNVVEAVAPSANPPDEKPAPAPAETAATDTVVAPANPAPTNADQITPVEPAPPSVVPVAAPAADATNAPPAPETPAYPRALPVDLDHPDSTNTPPAPPATDVPPANGTAPATGEVVPPVATPVPVDPNTGGDPGATTPPVAQPVDPNATGTNAPPPNP